ncbi:MAG: hypothetical protein K8T20_04025 [Planctomycetes bacterium]|nr:hypothetical protein [Planctomycetota bacterium]
MANSRLSGEKAQAAHGQWMTSSSGESLPVATMAQWYLPRIAVQDPSGEKLAAVTYRLFPWPADAFLVTRPVTVSVQTALPVHLSTWRTKSPFGERFAKTASSFEGASMVGGYSAA